MLSAFTTFGLVFTSLFIVIDPITTIPPYLTLTRDFDPPTRRRVIAQATLVALGVLLSFAAGGAWALELFGVSPLALRVAGAAIFAGLGWEALHAEHSGVQITHDEVREVRENHPTQVAIIPLAFPMLAGVGALSSVAAHMASATTLLDRCAVYAAIIAAAGASYIVLRSALVIERRLGQTGLNILTRLGGLVLLLLAVQWGIDAVVEIGTRIRTAAA